MTYETKTNFEQSSAPALGTVNTQYTTKNAPACIESNSKPKLFTSFEFSQELCAMIIEAELLIMEKYNSYSKGMNKKLTQKEFEYYLDKTPYRKLKADNDPSPALILRAAASCLYLCIEVKRDDMHRVFFGRNILKYEHAFEASNKKYVRVEFSESLSGFTTTHYEYLKKIYPKAKDGAELAKLAFSDVLMFAARFTGKFYTHLSSAGSKKWAMQLFHLDMLQFIDEQKKVLVDVFSRTASIALASMGIFDEIHCGDKDKRFVNFFEVLRDYPVALVLRIRSIAIVFKNTVLNMGYSEDEQEEHGKKFLADICTRLDYKLHNAKKSLKIDTAACLIYWINFSFSGFGKDFSLEQASKFINSLNTVCNDLLYTSMVLTDEENSRGIHKGIYKKTADGLAYQLVNEPSKNTVSICPICYEHWGFMKPILKNRDNPNCVLTLDPPYPRQFLFLCGDYKDGFGEKELINLFRALKGAKCKAILFNSSNIDYQATVKRYGCRLVGTYKKDKNSTEVTQVYSLNIIPDEKFFDPKNHGELYCGGWR